MLFGFLILSLLQPVQLFLSKCQGSDITVTCLSNWSDCCWDDKCHHTICYSSSTNSQFCSTSC